ncbi:ArsR family transcriptional regulator [Herbihabitans rhizosphaerae]|uniref:ArsR family transcriptional regulator n=1 Tax=Herbihabitans rhizosphaerae TaxID=1872711 RepID=A0A4Q7KHH8_9PSEU|nr:metalloregulator ArsR/SmtB family transcription factor [Herbihabitans rhizosphaerae]RZS34351.1 ArsR family transcriptional regulator [Herbihabitans rhizosphaerae]
MDVAGAIADEVRREILVLLHDGPRTAGEIAGRFPISRPAISRHLRVLRESGLVSDELSGRQRIYRLHPEPLRELAAWLARFTTESKWEQRLDALETEVHRTKRDKTRQDIEKGRTA